MNNGYSDDKNEPQLRRAGKGIFKQVLQAITKTPGNSAISPSREALEMREADPAKQYYRDQLFGFQCSLGYLQKFSSDVHRLTLKEFEEHLRELVKQEGGTVDKRRTAMQASAALKVLESVRCQYGWSDEDEVLGHVVQAALVLGQYQLNRRRF